MRRRAHVSWILIGGLVVAILSCTKLRDDLPAPTAVAGTVHPAGWQDSTSAGFHGSYLKDRAYNLASCASCHGAAYNGGTSGVSCFRCHTSYPHRPGWSIEGSAGFHGAYIRTSSWDMMQCRPCHGAAYDGGRSGVSCLSCHDKAAGPENCTTCHGDTNPAPPRDLDGNTSTSAPGVGAHQAHIAGSAIASSVACGECHLVPLGVYDPGHLDNTRPAALAFNGPLGILASAGGSHVPHPSYTPGTLKCASIFCHGDWRLEKAASTYPFAYADSVMSGANASPVWTGGSAQAACGTCHGLPPAGHFATALSRCASCHTGVVNTAGDIIDSAAHINGKINVFGDEYSF